MATSCFENFIGLKCVSTSTPKSGLFIDDLEGINLRFAADVADSGFTSGINLIQSKIAFATQLVLDEISRFATPYFRMNSLIDELKVGEWSTPLTYLTPSAFDKGLRIRTRESRMLRIRIQSVQIRLQEVNFSGNIMIEDGIFSSSFPFTTDADGFAEIFPNYLSDTSEVYVVTDNTSINPVNTKVKSSCNCSTAKSRFLTANGWNGTSTSSTSFGLVVHAVAECSSDEIACILAQKIRFPILYKSGIEIVKEAMTTDRLNSVTLLDSEKCEFMLQEFQTQYEQHFQTTIKSLPSLFTRMDDVCVVCNQSRFVYGLP
jgi:hypothetical protein